jgi:hypothetical protein
MAEVALLEIPDDCAILAAVGCVALRHSQLDYVLRLILKDAGDLQFDEAMSKTKRCGAKELRKSVWRCIKDRLGENELSKFDRMKRPREKSQRR